jgi:undecaprenyl pyrophosphate synthase
MNTQLSTVAQYDEFRAKIAEVSQVCDFIPDVTSKEGYEKSKRVALDVGKVLTNLEKKRKELKKESLEFGRNVDSQAKEIAEELESFQLPHKNAYKELDNLKKEREEARKAELSERVEQIATLPEMMRDSDSDSVKAAIEDLNNEECLDFYEFTEQALKARKSSLAALSEMFGQKLQQEKEAAELDRLRKEAAKREQKDREERLVKEALLGAERKAQAEKEAAEKREQDLKNAAIQAEEKAKREIADAARKAEEEKQQEILAKEKREANEKHCRKIHMEALQSLIGEGVDERQAAVVVKLIADGLIKNISIKY